jgi:hypothetical protein
MNNNHRTIVLDLVNADAVSFDADVLVLKYAQNHYGLDRAVSEKGVRLGIDTSEFSPAPGIARLFPSRGATAATNILVVGVIALYAFGYREIRLFARTALEALAAQQTLGGVSHVCLTLHGAEYGLDEIEAFEAEIAGLIDAITAGQIPATLQKVSIAEFDSGRAKRLESVLRDLLPRGYVETNFGDYVHSSNADVAEKLRSVGYASHQKPNIFVAMPFKQEMEDVYEYGIQNAVRKAGFLCERSDMSSFTGNVMDWVRQRIRSASFVVADLTGANPNVYLEVGYAWGSGVRTVLLSHGSHHLQFDTRGHRCIVYNRIKDLEGRLYQELVSLSKENIS